jgi:tetratricopeptide (TPR) repeat protein
MAEHFMNVQNYDEAVKYANKAIGIDERKTYAYYVLGKTYLAQGDLSKAEEKLLAGLEVLETDPSLLGGNKDLVRDDFYKELISLYESKKDNASVEKYRELLNS